MKRSLMNMVFAAGVALSAFSVAAEPGQTVIAVVNGKDLSLEKAYELHQSIPELSQAKFEAVFPMIRDQMVAEVLLKGEVEKANFDNDNEVQERAKRCVEAAKLEVMLKRKVEGRMTKEKVKGLFEKLMKEYKKQVEVKAQHILVATEKEAKDIIAKLEKGAMSFVEAVKQHTQDKASIEKDGALSDNYFIKDQANELLGPDFAKAVFELKSGSFSHHPVKTRFGYHVVKVQDSRMTTPPKFEEVEPQLRMLKSQEILMEILDELKKSANVKLFDMHGKPEKAAAKHAAHKHPAHHGAAHHVAVPKSGATKAAGEAEVSL